MKKEFIQVNRLKIESVTKKVTVVLAGIAFTFFSLTLDSNATNDVIVIDEQKTEVIVAEKPCLHLISDAYATLCDKNPEAGTLRPVYEFMRKGLEVINAEKVSMDCNTESGMLNISFRLPEGVILSVTKLGETLNDNLVAFNIFSKRQLILSDVCEINMLADYIENVQSKSV